MTHRNDDQVRRQHSRLQVPVRPFAPPTRTKFISQPSEVIRTITDSSLPANNPTRRPGYRSSAILSNIVFRWCQATTENYRTDGHHFLEGFSILLTRNRTQKINHYDATGRQVKLTAEEKKRQAADDGRSSLILEENLPHPS